MLSLCYQKKLANLSILTLDMFNLANFNLQGSQHDSHFIDMTIKS